MKLITAQEVLQRDSLSIDKVTFMIQEWLPKIKEKIGLETDDSVELIIMPSPVLLNEVEEPVQFTVFYNETGAIEQVQFAGVWLVGGLGMDENGEEVVTTFEPNHPLFERSVLEALTTMLLEVKTATLYKLPMQAREVARESLAKEANKLVTEFVGDCPEGWITALENEEFIDPKKLLN
jgi:hypothetical protein